ncbi:hypothetical protein DIKCMJMK_04254 [Shewanella oneidensis]|nr:hypothetical protein [Shewanella oneidensis]
MMAFLFAEFEPGVPYSKRSSCAMFHGRPSAMMAFLFTEFEPGFLILSAAPLPYSVKQAAKHLAACLHFESVAFDVGFDY